jgi:hypothetical protein
VLFVDCSRIDPKTHPSKESELRIFWFFLQNVCNMGGNISNRDFVVINLWTPQIAERSDPDTMEFVGKIIHEAMSGGEVIFHFVSLDKGAKLSTMEAIVRTSNRRAREWFSKSPKEVHVGNQEEVLSSLQAHGILSRNLPSSIGGTWTYEDDWISWLLHHVSLADIEQEAPGLQSPAGSKFPSESCPFQGNSVHEAMSDISADITA